jgi:hypothetical protein
MSPALSDWDIEAMLNPLGAFGMHGAAEPALAQANALTICGSMPGVEALLQSRRERSGEYGARRRPPSRTRELGKEGWR